MSRSRAGIEILEDKPECIHLDCVKKLGMALMTYFEKKLNFDDFNEYQMLLLSQTELF